MTAKIKIHSSIELECEDVDILSSAINDNTFKNPVYVANEERGRSNWQTDEFIETYQYQGRALILPRGYAQDLSNLLKTNDVEYEIIDERTDVPTDYQDRLNNVSFRNYQERAVSQAMQYNQGCIVSPTGSGKSLMGLEIIRRRRQKSLILVHRGELAKQWIDVIKNRLGIQAGFIGGGNWEVGDQITVAMVQALAARDEINVLSDAFGVVLVDEGHHAPAKTFYDVISLFSAKYRYMISATPTRRDGLEQIIYLAVGPILSEIDRMEVEEIGATVPATVKAIDTGFTPRYADTWHKYLAQSTSEEPRNDLIINLALSQKSHSLILTDRVAHAEKLSEMLHRRGVDHALAHGKIRDRSEAFSKMKESYITVGTTSMLGEGIDVCAWSILIMASPISSETKLLQAIGRVVRSSEGKKEAVVYDLRDDCGFSGASFKKRFEIYKKHNLLVEFNRKAA